MSIETISSETIMTEEICSVGNDFTDRKLPVDAFSEKTLEKTENKTCNNINDDSNTPSNIHVENDNQISLSQETLYRENSEDKIDCKYKNLEDNKTSILVACLDNGKHSIDTSQSEIIKPLINEPNHSKFEENSKFVEIANEVQKERKSSYDENNCNSTNNLNEEFIDVEVSGELNCDDEYFSCPFRPMSPQSQLRDLCKRGDADQLDKFLAEMCDSDNNDCAINESDSQNELKCTKLIDKSKVRLILNIVLLKNLNRNLFTNAFSYL